jgi:putative ABC transport system permease protein
MVLSEFTKTATFRKTLLGLKECSWKCFPTPMLAVRDNLAESFDALRAHKLRASLTMLGLTMGVATLITVMTLVQGANVYVEQKIANLGTNVFQVARTPFAVTDFNIVIKALKFRKIELDDMQAIADRCTACGEVGATASATVRVRYGNKEVTDVSLSGQTATMADIDTRTVERGRYFTASEADHRANVCLIGDTLVQQLFLGVDPIGKTIRVVNDEFTVIGTIEKIGSVLGQDQDNFVMIPLSNFLRMQGAHTSLTINVKTRTDKFEPAQDQAQLTIRARHHLTANMEDDFFIGTKESYMALWRSISSAFFAVFIMVSVISVVVGGIVIMNVMLVSVTARRREIGVRLAVGATKLDIVRQFIAESVTMCIAGGVVGIALGFLVALLLRTFTPFPASVQSWVAMLGVVLSSVVGLFFGIYPAVRASRLDPIVALRAD